MENSYEFSLYGWCDDQVNGLFGYEYLYWSVPQITSIGSDLNDFVYNSVVYLQPKIYGAVDKGPCYGHFLDEIVGPEITSCYISYTEIPEKLNDAPVHSDGEVYERKGETYSSNENGDKEGEGDTSVLSRFKSTLKRDSDLKECDLKEYYFNDTDWLRIPKPEIRYEDESEKRILYVLLASLKMSILEQYMNENYDKKKKKLYRKACKGIRKKKKKLKELKWRRHRLESIREDEEEEDEEEEDEAVSAEVEGDETLQNDVQNIEKDDVGKIEPRVESQKQDEDHHRVKVGDVYVRYAPDRYRVFCLENRKKKRFPAVRKFFGRIFSYVKKPN